MPSYKVLKPGYQGKLYDPNGKRRTLHRDEPFLKGEDGEEQVPSWLERIKEETTAEKKKRVAAEKKQAAAIKKQQKDIDDASFMGDGEQSPAVETL